MSGAPREAITIAIIISLAAGCLKYSSGIRSYISKPAQSLVSIKQGLVSKDNRTALAVAVGAIAIVLAIVFSGMNRGGQPASSGGREFIKGTPYAGSNPGEVQYSCPDGYRHGKASIWDPYCYKN